MSATPHLNGKATLLLNRLAVTEKFIEWLPKGDDAKPEWVTISRPLTPERIQAHLDGKVCVGTYPHADGVARSGIIDVDLHLDREPTLAEVATVERYAKQKAIELETLGIKGLLLRGHDAGSYHTRFDVAPMAADRLGRWLKAFVADAAPVHVDTFPAPSGGGNAVRLPGRHHKRPDQWSSSWSGSAWEPWPAALDRLLELPTNPARLFPDPGIPKTEHTATSSGDRLRVGDIFNLLVPIEKVLRAHGWHSEREDGERIRFTRPGKETGLSGSVMDGTFWVYTSSIPGLPPTSESDNIPYTAFGLVAHLVFGGDFKKAARELAKKGFCPHPAEPIPTFGKGRVSDVSDVGRVGPYRPFPARLLPEVVREYVAATAAAMNCDPSYSALPALALLGAAIGSTHMIWPKSSWKEPAYVFATTIGFSGTTKSPPFRDIEDIAQDINDRLDQEYRRLSEEFEIKMEEWMEAKENKEEVGEKPVAPVERSFVESDTTIQALVGTLQDNPRGILVACDELAGWISGFTRYSGRSGASDLPHWLQLSNAGTVNTRRKTGDRTRVRVRGVGVSVCGTIQPDILALAMTEELRASGFLARLIVAYPDRRKRVWTESEVDPVVRDRFVKLVDALFALKAGLWPDTSRMKPHLVKLSPEAKANFVRFYNANGEAMETASENEAAARSKLEGYSLRFALIAHCCRHRDKAKEHPIGLEDMNAAIELTAWFLYESSRVYAVLGETAEVREIRDLHKLVLRLAAKPGKGGRITPRDLQNSSGRKYRTADAAKAALERLVGQGLGAWEGVPPTHFRPCPTPDTSDSVGGDDDQGDGDDGEGVSDTRADTGPPTDPHSGDAPDATTEPEDTYGESWEIDPEWVSDMSDCRRNSPPENSPCEEAPTSTSECQTAGSSVGHPEFRSTPSRSADCRHELTGFDAAFNPARYMKRPRKRRSPKTHTKIEKSADSPEKPEAFTLVTSRAGLSAVVSAIEDGGGVIGLDCETTGLRHQVDSVRLLQLATARGTFCIDLFALPDPTADLAELFEVLARAEVIGHNLTAFDLPFLARMGFAPTRVFDTALASRVLYAGEREDHDLATTVLRELGRVMDKSQQRTDWSMRLTDEQLAYAAADATVLLPLAIALREKANARGVTAVMDLEMCCALPLARLAAQGVEFDSDSWRTLARDATERKLTLMAEMNAMAPNPMCLPGIEGWDWNSNTSDVLAAFATVGISLADTKEETLAGIDHPLARRLLDYRQATKRADTYGNDWVTKNVTRGRVYATWNQCQAKTGRMSCSQPNLQQVPREKSYRECFVARPGHLLIKCDFSQIELRIAAKVTGDKRMLDAYMAREDLHTLTAARFLGVSKDAVTKEARQMAKPVNFGAIYGLGPRSLRLKAKADYGKDMTESQAKGFLEAFFAEFPGVRRWHNRLKREKGSEVRTLGDRRVAVGADQFYGAKANYIVQGTGGDGLKRAMVLLWDRRLECAKAEMVLAVHDEIVVEAPVDVAANASAWLKKAMLDGMAPLIDPIPVEVEVSTGRTWGG